PHACLYVGRKEHAHRHITNLTFEVLGSVDGHDAGMFVCRLRLDARDECMPVWTAENGHMEHPNQFDIINICCLPRNQTGVFTPFDRRANHRCNAHVCACPFSNDEERNSALLRMSETSYARREIRVAHKSFDE